MSLSHVTLPSDLDAVEGRGGLIAPVLMGLAFLLIALFGVFLAAKSTDQLAYVEGFLFLAFAFLMSMRYFGKKI
ncbi:hypothetical protein [Zavarzinia aquatilis]|nr:hypothetical protein [Zavarzinia aquatilis]